jgi:phage shock protein PspC (stress-responsive transcriptional regulator)
MVATGAGGHPLAMTTITDIPEIRRLQRSRSDRKVAGVSGGLARYFEIHPAVFRVGFVVLTLIGGAGILIYAAAALVMPDEGKEDSVATAALRNRRDRPWPLIGLGLLAVAGAALLSRATLWPHGDSWFLFLVAGAVILWITRHPAADPTKDAAELAAEDSRRVRRVGRNIAIALASLIALVLVAAAVFAAVFDVHVGRGIGDRTVAVTSTENLHSDYRLGIGSLELDLGALQLPVGETHVDASVDVGELRVIVPQGVGLRIHGTATVSVQTAAMPRATSCSPEPACSCSTLTSEPDP